MNEYLLTMLVIAAAANIFTNIRIILLMKRRIKKADDILNAKTSD